ncbi:MAG: hypothetical protein KDC85_11545 [Saprospiraceae bacterium]|nr:hypothetical protein [Saprospiraceae bacterium]MCB9323247.1 hypothetical protein [Lewinellaceae bacterium]
MRYLFFFILAVFISSCTKLSTETFVPTDTLTVFNDNPIMFCGLEVGQKSAYVLLQGNQYFNNQANDDYQYLHDTLIAEIVAQDENGFLVKEYLTPGSDPLPDGVYYMADSTYQYYLKTHLDSIKIYHPEAEYGILSLLYWHNDQTLALSNFTNQEADIVGWKTSLSYCECDQTAYDPFYELFGTPYENLNISILNAFMQVDGPGSTYIYSNLNGMIRTSHYGWWTQSGFGWDLLGSE